MSDKTKPYLDTQILIRVNSAWLGRLDKWRNEQTVPPNRSDIIRVAVEQLLEKKAKKK